MAGITDLSIRRPVATAMVYLILIVVGLVTGAIYGALVKGSRVYRAEAKTIAHIARVFLDDCIAKHLRGELDAATASMARSFHMTPTSTAPPATKNVAGTP